MMTPEEAKVALEEFLEARHPNIPIKDLARDASAGDLVIIKPCCCDHPPNHANPGERHHHRISVVGVVYGNGKPFKFWAELAGVLPEAKDVFKEEGG